MSKFKVGQFIKWTAEEGSHIGQVLRVTDARIEFQTQHGAMSVPLTDGTFEETQAIDLTTKDRVIPQGEHVTAHKRTEAKAKSAPAAGSKLEQAVAIYKEMPGASRKELIDAFVSKLGMTPAGASTYASTVKKHV